MSTDIRLYTRRLEEIKRQFVESILVEPRLEFDSQGEWLRRRVDVLRSSDCLVFFEDHVGFIGRGVVADVHTARALRLPVWFACGDGCFLSDGQFFINVNADAYWNEYAQVSYRHVDRH